jgi:hypothetical protein
MNRTFVAFGAWLLAAAGPALAQDPGQPATGAASAPASPKTGTGVQIDVVPLIRSLIKHSRPKPAPAVQAAGQVPAKPPPAVPAVVVDPPAPSPVITEPAVAQAPPPPVPPAVRPEPRPRVVAAAAAPKPSLPPVQAVDTRPVVVSRDPVPSPPPVESPETTTIAAPAAVASAPTVVSTTPIEPPLQLDRIWLFAALFGLLALAIAAAGIAIRHGRMVRRTRRMLRIEPRLDLGRGRCSASGLAFAGVHDG